MRVLANSYAEFTNSLVFPAVSPLSSRLHLHSCLERALLVRSLYVYVRFCMRWPAHSSTVCRYVRFSRPVGHRCWLVVLCGLLMPLLLVKDSMVKMTKLSLRITIAVSSEGFYFLGSCRGLFNRLTCQRLTRIHFRQILAVAF